MKRLLIFLTIPVSLLFSCSKDSAIPTNEPILEEEEILSPFFYPESEAKWFIYVEFPSTGESIQYNETLYLGKDTLLKTRTIPDNRTTISDADSATIKQYKKILYSSLYYDPNGITYQDSGTHGWFRQDKIEQKVYNTRIYAGEYYEELVVNFNLNVGDTADFIDEIYSTLLVSSIDSVMLGDIPLKVLNIAGIYTPSISKPYYQALDIYDYDFTNITPPGNLIWRKLVYKSDTLLISTN